MLFANRYFSQGIRFDSRVYVNLLHASISSAVIQSFYKFTSLSTACQTFSFG